MVRGKTGRRVEGLLRPSPRALYRHRWCPLWSPPAPTYADPPRSLPSDRWLPPYRHSAACALWHTRDNRRQRLCWSDYRRTQSEVPCREVADQRFGIDAAQLLFPTEKATTGTSVAFRPWFSQLFVERYVGIAINGGDHCRFATGGEIFDIGDDGLVIAVAERGVDLPRYLCPGSLWHAGRRGGSCWWCADRRSPSPAERNV